ncbi:YitT family protein [Egicoccus sp. AB-alg6-2]|uniref:membrane protein YczE n=1 Tax=Egicoccus sp. AB-alg6-2 TaxID=3242692 RepID=UPI00359DB07B
MLPRPPRHELRRRLPRLLVGLVLCGLGIAVMVAAELGLGPWDVLHQGLSRMTRIPIGTVGILVGLVVLLAWLPLRERPGVGTVLNVVVIGVVIDVTLLVLDTPNASWLRWLYMAAGPVLFGVGSGFYIGAGLGAGPRDGIMTGLARRGLSVGWVRGCLEMSVLALGWLLGGTVGIGTVVFAATIGPIVHVTLPRLAMQDVPEHPPPGARSAR